MKSSFPGCGRRTALALAGASAADAALSVPTPDAKGSHGTVSKRGGTLNMLIEPEPPTLVALTNSADPSLLVSAKVTEGLLSYDFDLNPRPQLATHWSVSPDGQQIAFRLRKGVTWHDGTAFTSQDVAFSIALLKEVHPRGRTTFAGVAEVQTPDLYTAVVVLSKPAPFLLYALAASESPIVPRHVYEGTDVQSNPNGSAPIGTGPFVFREWVRGSHIIYDRNPIYWDAPKPYVDRLVIRFIEDTAVKVSAIETGYIDLAPGTPVPLGELHRLASNPDLVFEPNGYQYTNQLVRLEFNLDSRQLGRLEVRQAIAHAIDRQMIVDQAWLGYAEAAFGPISPDLKRFYTPNLPTPAFDPARAERLLDQAGLPRGTNGVRLELALDYVPAGDGYKRTAACISQALSAIGVEATPRHQDFPSYIKRIYTDRSFDLAVSRMNNMFDPTVGVQRVFWSRSFRRGVPFSNGSHYESREVDEILERASVEIDASRRLRYFQEFQRIIVRDLPDVTLLAPKQVTIASKRVLDHTVTADGTAGNLADAYVV